MCRCKVDRRITFSFLWIKLARGSSSNAATEREVLGSISRLGIFDKEFLSSIHGVLNLMYTRLIAIDSPPITWGLNLTGEIWVCVGAPA